MSKGNISYKRGVTFCIHPKTGMSIYMYQDKPGEYMDAHGNSVSDQMADEAGFPIEKHRKEKVKRERMAQAMSAIERELERDDLEKKSEPVAERKGFKIMDIGLGRHNVIDPDGNVLNTTPLTRDIADMLLDQMTKDLAGKPHAAKALAPEKTK